MCLLKKQIYFLVNVKPGNSLGNFLCDFRTLCSKDLALHLLKKLFLLTVTL